MRVAAVVLVCLLIYLFLIMPRTRKGAELKKFLGGTRHQGRFASSNRLYFAHRGLHDNRTDAPENSMKAFRKAVNAGYGIELDVQLTKDRVPVVFHDETLKRACGAAGKVRDYTYEELQQFVLFQSGERIPKFSDFLNLVDGKVPLIIEIKVYEKAEAVCRLADELIRAYRGVYCIESFHPLAVKWYKDHRPEVVRGQLSSNFNKPGKTESPPMLLVHYLLLNFLGRPDFIAYDCRFKKNLSRILCRKMYSALSVAWTVKSQKELDECRKDFDLFIFEGFIPNM